jgi:hypothetical protein
VIEQHPYRRPAAWTVVHNATLDWMGYGNMEPERAAMPRYLCATRQRAIGN